MHRINVKKVGRIMTIMTLFVMSAVGVKAQETANMSVGATMLSHYIWRGMELADASIQPSLKIGWKGLSLTAEGSMGLADANDLKEFDITLGYQTGAFSFGLVDYWAETPTEKRYFIYGTHSSNHTFEAFVAYDFGVMKASWQTYFAGADGVKSNGERAYSSYFELQAPFRMADFDCLATAAMVPWATTAYETSGFGVTNLGLKISKGLPITDRFKLPVFFEVVGNPTSQRAYVIFGLSITSN